MALGSPFQLGQTPAPQPWTPPGLLGMFMPLILELIGGYDTSGRPLLKMPTFGADVRTAQDRVFGQNTLLAARAIQSLEEQAYKSSIDNIFGAGTMGGLGGIGKGLMTVGSPLLSLFMQSQDPTFGAMKQSLIGNSAMIMSGITGGRTFENPARNAQIIGSLYSAMYSNTWGQDFTKKLGFTYGLTETEMAPLITRMASSGAFNNLFNEKDSQGKTFFDKYNDLVEAKGNYAAAEKRNAGADELTRLQNEINNKQLEVDKIQRKVDESVKRTMESVNRTISSMKGLFGTAENAAEFLESFYGSDAFTDTVTGRQNRAKAETLSNQLISMAGRYGISATALGSVMENTLGGVATGLGFSAEEQQFGFGRGMGAWMSKNAAFSAGAAAGGDRDKFKKLLYGFSQRMTDAAASQNMKVHTMLQYAVKKGLITETEAGRLRTTLSSGDQGTRQAGIRELFDAFGGYSEGMSIMNDQNAIALMSESFNSDEQEAVNNAVTRTIGNEGKMSLQNARNQRISRSARRALRQQGMRRGQINEIYNTASASAMETALNGVENGDSIKAGADEVYRNAIADGKTPAEAQRMKADYLRDAAQNFLSAEDAEKVITAGNEAGANALDRAANGPENKERSELAKKIEFAQRRRGWSREERKLLRAAKSALRKGDVNRAKSLFDQFVSRTGARGQMIDKKSFSSGSTADKDLGEIDKGRAGTAAGLSASASSTIGENVATEGSPEDVASAQDLSAQTKVTADNGEKTSHEAVIKMLSGKGIAGLLLGDEANAEEFDQTTIGKFIKALEEMFEKLWRKGKDDLREAGAQP